jgi:fatty aldehyde decarbonylase
MQTRMKTFRVLSSERAVVRDLLSQAITAELIGMSNFATLADITDDTDEKMAAVQQAETRRVHAEGMINLAAQFDLRPQGNTKGVYWRDFRNAFLKYARKGDYSACGIIQQVLFESVAVSFYDDVGVELDNAIGEFFCVLAEQERDTLNDTIHRLKPECNKNPEAFSRKLEQIHSDCMTVLARWAARTDLSGHCGICAGNCMKDALHELNLNMTSLRGNALKVYVVTLERIGIPVHRSLPWIAGLPM